MKRKTKASTASSAPQDSVVSTPKPITGPSQRRQRGRPCTQPSTTPALEMTDSTIDTPECSTTPASQKTKPKPRPRAQRANTANGAAVNEQSSPQTTEEPRQDSTTEVRAFEPRPMVIGTKEAQTEAVANIDAEQGATEIAQCTLADDSRTADATRSSSSEPHSKNTAPIPRRGRGRPRGSGRGRGSRGGRGRGTGLERVQVEGLAATDPEPESKSGAYVERPAKKRRTRQGDHLSDVGEVIPSEGNVGPGQPQEETVNGASVHESEKSADASSVPGGDACPTEPDHQPLPTAKAIRGRKKRGAQPLRAALTRQSARLRNTRT
jgi:hypothetical protein